MSTSLVGRRLWRAFLYTCSGLRYAVLKERAFRQELILAIILIPFALWLPVAGLERVLLVGSVLLVLLVELLNSSIEAAVDRISPEWHPLSKRAKDLGSAAVFVALCLCGFTWISLSGPLLVQLISKS